MIIIILANVPQTLVTKTTTATKAATTSSSMILQIGPLPLENMITGFETGAAATRKTTTSRKNEQQ